MKSKWAEIRNNFFDEEDRVVCIDAWLTDDGNEEGKVIAKINVDTQKITYIDNDAKKDKYANEMIKEVFSDIKNGLYKEN